MILAYPVISMTADIHSIIAGLERTCLEKTPIRVWWRICQTKRRSLPKRHPTFPFHTNADTGVPPENSVAFYLALRKSGVPAEMHIYERGRHGVGLAPEDRELSTWPDRLLGWMRGRGLLN